MNGMDDTMFACPLFHQHLTVSTILADSPVLSCQDEYVVIQNTSVSLVCSVDAFPAPSAIRWRRKASDKTLMTGDKFTIDDVQMTDGGVYVCTATNNMTDYTGQSRTGIGSCAVRVKVTCKYIHTSVYIHRCKDCIFFTWLVTW